MKELKDRRIWVTGASSGIGKALACELADRGSVVIASGRNKERLEETCGHNGDRMHALPLDITDKTANREAAAWIEEKFGALDISVLNAGTCEYVDVKKFDSDMIERVTRINYMGFVYGIEVSLDLLRKGKDPYLVGMSSTVAYTGLPRAEAYGTTKAAIRHFLQSLRVDLTPEGIDVSIICPGFVETPLTDLNDFPMPMIITKERAAKYIADGMRRRKHEIAFPPMFVFMLKSLAALPSPIRNKVLVKMMKK